MTTSARTCTALGEGVQFDTPKNRALMIDDTELEGTYILEVPVQTRPVPQAVLKYADDKGVTIRDVTGHEYN